jgi:DNA-binding XRE family transcriptional regulator
MEDLTATRGYGMILTGMPIGKLPDELWELREAAGITQELLAAHLGLNQKKLEAMENGRIPISEEIEVAWRRTCRRYLAYCAVRFGAVDEDCVKLTSDEVRQASELLGENLRAKREKKTKRSESRRKAA